MKLVLILAVNLAFFFSQRNAAVAQLLVPPQTAEVAVTGVVENAQAAPIPRQEVVLNEGGVQHRTFTNSVQHRVQTFFSYRIFAF
jgi:hypothetical protein